jgi:F-type H+-transporting ATPase subunit a
MEHHGPVSWLLRLPLLPHDSHYLHVNGAVLVLCFIIVVSVIAFFKIRGKKDSFIIPPPAPSLIGIVDLLVESLRKMVLASLGAHGEKHFAFIASLFIFVWVSNLMGLLPLSESPSSNLNTTLALGASSFVYYNVMGIRSMGLVGYAKHFLMGLGVFGIPIAAF